jgi:hypothetical protein
LAGILDSSKVNLVKQEAHVTIIGNPLILLGWPACAPSIPPLGSESKGHNDKKIFLLREIQDRRVNLSHYDERHWKNQEQNRGRSRNVKIPISTKRQSQESNPVLGLKLKVGGNIVCITPQTSNFTSLRRIIVPIVF